MKEFEIPLFFKSSIISKIKENRRVKDKLKKDFSPTLISIGNFNVYLSRHFGFCYGVENAVEIAYKAIEENKDKRIFLLSEMIHNPEVNQDLKEKGVQFIMDTKGQYLIDFKDLNKDDIVIVPAFGTTIEIQQNLEKIGISPYQFDTTCPFVEKVWNKASQIGQKGYSIIIHGKPNHEETRATFSHSLQHSPTIVIKNLDEAKKLMKYIKKESSSDDFFKEFEGRFSQGFDPEKDLEKLGVVNQTTMNAEETQEISDYIKEGINAFYSVKDSNNESHFANMRDTLCYATNDNQKATKELLKTPADYAIIVGGYNSSNTTHLVEISEKTLATYFIQSDKNIHDNNSLTFFDIHDKKEITQPEFFVENSQATVLLSCGASCPDSVMERVLLKLFLKNNKNYNLSEIKEILEKQV